MIFTTGLNWLVWPVNWSSLSTRLATGVRSRYIIMPQTWQPPWKLNLVQIKLARHLQALIRLVSCSVSLKGNSQGHYTRDTCVHCLAVSSKLFHSRSLSVRSFGRSDSALWRRSSKGRGICRETLKRQIDSLHSQLSQQWRRNWARAGGLEGTSVEWLCEVSGCTGQTVQVPSIHEPTLVMSQCRWRMNEVMLPTRLHSRC